MGAIRVAQAYTGPIGSEIIRRLAGHPQMRLVGVLVHSPEKAGRDSGVVAGTDANGIRTTQSLDELIALRPDGIIWSGSQFDVPAYARILAAGINLYTGIGGYYLKGQPEEAVLAAAAQKGQASFCAGGNIPGLISDMLPLFLTGYTGRIRHIRAWQRNHMDLNPSAAQMQGGLGIGLPPGGHPFVEQLNAGFSAAIAQSARLVADALGVRFEGVELTNVDYAVAPRRQILQPSGLVIEAGMTAAVRWTWVGRAEGREFYTLCNEQTAILGLGEGWRETYDEPAYRVEIEGQPSLVLNLGWSSGSAPATANYSLNVARAMNIMTRLVVAQPGLLTPMDFPMPVASDGLV